MQENIPIKGFVESSSILRNLATKAYSVSGRIADRNNHGIIIFDENLGVLFANKIALVTLNCKDISMLDSIVKPKFFDGNKDVGEDLFVRAISHPNCPIKLPVMGYLLFSDKSKLGIRGVLEYKTYVFKGLGNVYELDLYASSAIPDANVFNVINKTAHIYPYYYDDRTECFQFPFNVPPFMQNYFSESFVSISDLLKFLYPADLNKVIPYVHQINKLDILDQNYSASWRIRELDGSYNWYETRFIRTLIPGERKYRLTIGCFIECDNVYSRITKLTQASSETERTAEIQQTFLATMSHDIRTPLNSIMGFTDIITTEKLEDEEKIKYGKIVRQNGRMLLSLVNDILDLSKIQAGTLRVIPKMVDVISLFENLKLTMREKLSNIDVTMTFHNPYKKLDVFIDGNRFLQVMNNLMTNAIKYTPKGTIDAFLSYGDNKLKFEVVDTGIGIPDNKQIYVFKPFQKLDNFAKGNGLGLSIVAKIIDMMNGQYGFISKEGVGSTFWVIFPVIVDESKLIKKDR